MTQPYDGTGAHEPVNTRYDDTSTADTAKAQAAGVAQDAKSEAAGVAQDAKLHGQRVASTAADEARGVAEHAKNEARGLLGQAQNELSTQAGTQQQRLAGLMREVSEELTGILDPYNTDYKQGFVTDLAQQAGGRLQNATSWLEGREPADVVNEMARFARRRPGTFLAAAALAGLVVGRLSRGMADDARDSGAPRQLQGYGYDTRSTYAQGYAQPGYGQASYGQSPYTQSAYTQSSYAQPTYESSYRGTDATYGRTDTLATPTNPTYDGTSATGSADAPSNSAYTGAGTFGDAHGLSDGETRRFPTVPEPEQTYRPGAGEATTDEGGR